MVIAGGRIVAVERTTDVPDRYLLPGFIDAHVHIESSMLLPTEFARMATIHGSIGAVADPHEIANVTGIDGIRFMLDNAALTPFHFCFGAPSCVPATPFESSGAVLGLAEIDELLRMPEIGYLAEMMNYPGVIEEDPLVMGKLALARTHGKPVDGHAPGLRGVAAERYAAAGIGTDHECYSLEEALDKIGCGMQILIREGSSARNFDTLLPLLESHPDRVMFCSDDKHPDDLLHGYLDTLIRRAIAAGCDPLAAIRACTRNPVRHYRLAVGLLQPGDPADFVITDNLRDLTILATYINGDKVAENGTALLPKLSEIPVNS
ncbi:MAG: adenine deaminase, partial [Geobacter sp.]|nr:adenine deaminase [Geobacter sp.]